PSTCDTPHRQSGVSCPCLVLHHTILGESSVASRPSPLRSHRIDLIKLGGGSELSHR
ncbi:hypothetical protein BaRGS_00011415, partial [Batillaria attramentaria]